MCMHDYKHNQVSIHFLNQPDESSEDEFCFRVEDNGNLVKWDFSMEAANQ